MRHKVQARSISTWKIDVRPTLNILSGEMIERILAEAKRIMARHGIEPGGGIEATTFGAAAPGISTAPITRSARPARCRPGGGPPGAYPPDPRHSLQGARR